MHHVANLIQNGQRNIVVLSAVSGTTNKLVAIAAAFQDGDLQLAQERLYHLGSEYADFTKSLVAPAYQSAADDIVKDCLGTIQRLLDQAFEPAFEKVILAQGELISTQLFQLYLESQGLTSILLSALDFMRINDAHEPDAAYIREKLGLILEQNADTPLFITQGYICRNLSGGIDNLQRGGSDYTATLIGAAIEAEEIQIWTDIDGIHNNDPRVVQHTSPVRQVSYREAAELAYFGAKILHPTCVIPAESQNVPIRLKNTFAPNAPGTIISQAGSGQSLTAIAAKNGITALKIRSDRMLNAYGFLRRVFEVFEQYQTPIDMITTSEVSVSLTIDNATQLPAILTALREFGEVSVDQDQSIICIVGDALNEQLGYTKKIFAALSDIPIRMVSYGGSNNNISVLVPSTFKEQALLHLHEHLFQAAPHVNSFS